MKLFISDIEIPLPSNFKIARTKQVNDIGRLDNRQANFTQRIKLPKTKETQLAFDNLGSVGNTSNKPYSRNTARLINDNGESEIFNGYAVINKKSSTYEVIIYDGYIDFIKAIENEVITNIDISELNHLKNLDAVKETWTDDTLPYRYIVADYNGKMVYDTDNLNIDYLIPSVNVKWLWDKIFEYYGWTYEGSVFDTEKFNNLWLTYPKTIGDETQVTTQIYSVTYDDQIYYYNTGTINRVDYFGLLGGINETIVDSNGILGATFDVDFPISTSAQLNNTYLLAQEPKVLKINLSGSFANNGSIALRKFVPFSGSFEVIEELEYENGVDFDILWTASLQTGEAVSIYPVGDAGSVDVTVSVVEGNQVDFEEAFIDFEIRDFINEVLWNFALTPFKDKYTNNIKFLTHQEWLQTNDLIDWSDKYVSTVDEEYILKGYGQRNYLRRKYNEREQSYNDSYLYIDNVNIRDKVDIIKSLIYSPERDTTEILENDYNVYKFWNKENKDDGTVKYKELSGRFYFLRSETAYQEINIGSEFQGDTDSVTKFFRENYSHLSFKDIVQDYYLPIYSILNKSRMVTANIFLTDSDIHNIDFKKLVFIKQLGSYFIINKISNYIKKGVYPVELLEVDFREQQSDEVIPVDKRIVLNSNLVDGHEIVSDYAFLNYTPTSATITATHYADAHPVLGGTPSGTVLSTALNVSANSQTFTLTDPPITAEAGWYELRIEDQDGLMSNYAWVFVDFPAVDNTPSIDFFMVFGDGTFTIPAVRDIQYRFNNFTPTSATLTLQRFQLVGGSDVGEPITETITTFTPDVLHTISDIEFRAVFDFYRWTIVTDTISNTGTIQVF